MKKNEIDAIIFGSNIDISDEVTGEPVEEVVIPEEPVAEKKVAEKTEQKTFVEKTDDDVLKKQVENHEIKTNVNETVPPHDKKKEGGSVSSDYFRGSRKKGAVQKIRKEIKERGYVLADDEKEYTRYNLGGTNEIILTDRRLIALNESLQQIEIEKICGLSTCYKTIVATGKIVVSVLLILLGLGAAVAGYFFGASLPSWGQYVAYALGAVMVIIGIVLIASSMGKKFFLTIYTEPMTSFLTLKSGTLNANKTDNFINVAVGKEAFFAANLIGSDILTLKKELNRK